MLRPPRPTFRMALPVLAALWLLGVAAHSEAQTADQPKRGGTVNMSAYADAEVWEPVGSGSLSSVQAYSQLFPQLVEYDMTGKDTSRIVCDLCTDWKVSNGGRTFTFHLVKNAQWGDGTPITADDVVFSLSRYMDPKVPIGRSGPGEGGGPEAGRKDHQAPGLGRPLQASRVPARQLLQGCPQ
jgi:ABC-type transport system substrate-binding protein